MLKFLTVKDDVVLNAGKEQKVSCIQDAVHIATKLRNKLLKPSSMLPMGLYQVSVSHLKILISSCSKDIHHLVKSDIYPTDRQNYRSFEKISEKRVLDALKQNVIDSEATVIYIQLSRELTSAFIEENLTPEERLYRTWHGTYFFRAWNKWIQSAGYNSDNFITSNALAAIEINAYGMVHLLQKFRDSNQPSLFMPTLYNSQTCERTFAQFRSMTSANWTRINFAMQELIHIAGRIELLNDIVYDKLSTHDVNFPRVASKSNIIHKVYDLPSNEQISQILAKSRKNALEDALNLGMDISEMDILHCPLKKHAWRKPKKRQNVYETSDEESDIEDTFSCNSLRDYTKETGETDANSKYIDVMNEDGTSRLVLKSSVLYLLTDSNEKLSQSRLQRVQGADIAAITPSKKRKLDLYSSSQSAKKTKTLEGVYISNHLLIGQWCFFKLDQTNSDACGETENEKSPYEGT